MKVCKYSYLRTITLTLEYIGLLYRKTKLKKINTIVKIYHIPIWLKWLSKIWSLSLFKVSKIY